MGLRKKNFNIMGIHWKIQFLKEGVYSGKLPNGGAWIVCTFKRGFCKKEGEKVVFLEG